MILFLHRKDLRTEDLPAYEYILRRGRPSLHVLILDPQLLAGGRAEEHSGRSFLRHAARLEAEYRRLGGYLAVLYGDPAEVTEQLCRRLAIEELVLHRDVTPYALQRDERIRLAADQLGLPVVTFDEGPLADVDEFQAYAARGGKTTPYKVFTPYYQKWSSFLALYAPAPYPASVSQLSIVKSDELDDELLQRLAPPFDWRAAGEEEHPAEALQHFLNGGLAAYADTRDRYALEGTSGISRHLNCGALSIRQAYASVTASPVGEVWRRQLAWRDFYLYQARHDESFFRYEEQLDLSLLSDRFLEAWQCGETGIPIIDAAMTELHTTGRMPNRLRMITAMFLTKNLLCPFTLGEQYFRLKLADYDRVLNRGGWLWSASLGFDAAPYFRIMNPVTQSQTHDPTGAYIRRWLPQLRMLSDKEIHLPRPQAIVDLKASRARAIEVYKHLR
ncbi:cryptochrome/photolyase family protein [Paenibacillus sp. y28]|uniref:cryptochrome/photolyase family protein n=1 Tax=Paenibacillus sp. y28 TaxID=3129110 RepID=UPI0030167609